MAISVRTRFEVFKRDEFCCQYCGRRSPEVLLEVDHIVAVAKGGTDDPINLTTSCWDCNRGKSDVPLLQIMTGEDPHDRAILILERERQLEEYNHVVRQERERREAEGWQLWRWWQFEQGYRKKEDLETAPHQEIRWLFNALKYCPAEKIREFMDRALAKNMTKNLKYVGACVRNWRYEHQANQDMKDDL